MRSISLVNKTYWLVGASEGLGRALATALSAEGASLVLSARSAGRLEALAGGLTKARAVPMDVTDPASVSAGVAAAGAVDGVIYCAGSYEPMVARDWDTDAALAMTEVNYLGALRVLGEVVPGMIRAGRGDITLIGSLSAYRGLPGAVGYGASKAALLSLSETLRYDLRGSGVVVRVVNPGFIETRLTQKNSFPMPQLMSPEDAAARVLRALQSTRFRTDFPAPFSWYIRLLGMMPDVIAYRGR